MIPSKQRPRKISMQGEDGRDYVFLLKGHEDLRQDERVMQLFGQVTSNIRVHTAHAMLDYLCNTFSTRILSRLLSASCIFPATNRIEHYVRACFRNFILVNFFTYS